METNHPPASHTEGERVAAARRAAGLSQGNLADSQGVTQSTVARWEKGDIPLTLPVLRSIAETLRVPVSSLIPDCDQGAAA